MIKFRNPYSYGTQRYRVLDMLFSGDKSGRDFLKACIPEYRSRINEIDKDLRKHGFFIKHYRKDDPRFIYFGIRLDDLFESEVAA
jgi:hypothetical protein